MCSVNKVPLSSLQTIEAIARCGKLSLAADEMGLTPAALSIRLAKVEAALGQTLFVRSRAGMTPTETSKAIMPRLAQLLADLDEVVVDLAAAKTPPAELR